MAGEVNEALLLKLLQNMDSRHDSMYDELVQLRASFVRLTELSVELNHQKKKVAELESELSTLSTNITSVSEGLIVPMSIGKALKVFIIITLTALITVWVNRLTSEATLTPLVQQSIEKHLIKKLDMLEPKVGE